jgi:tetratricopeptide (TPR) repeat protein
MRRCAAIVAVVAAGVVPLRASASPVDVLRDAEGWFVYGDFAGVIERLAPLVDPTSQLADRRDLARSYELLGLSCFYLRRETEARKYFERLVRLEPEKHLDPLAVPPPAVNFYEEIRTALADELARQREALQKQLAEEDERRRQANIVVEKLELRRNNRLVAAMPLGAGQFQDERPVLGGLLLGSQVVLAGLSGAFYLAAENLRQPSGRYARADVGRAEGYQAAQLSCGYTALLVAIGGIVHAQLTFRDATEVNRERSAPGVQPDLGPPPAAPTPAQGLSFSF